MVYFVNQIISIFFWNFFFYNFNNKIATYLLLTLNDFFFIIFFVINTLIEILHSVYTVKFPFSFHFDIFQCFICVHFFSFIVSNETEWERDREIERDRNDVVWGDGEEKKNIYWIITLALIQKNLFFSIIFFK